METLQPDTVDDGAANLVYAAFDPYLFRELTKRFPLCIFRLTLISAHNGAYLQDCRVGDPWTDTIKPWATSSVEAERLWKLTEQLVGQSFNY